MGFDSIAVAVLFSAVVLTIGYVLIIGNSVLTEQAVESYREITNSAVKRLQSNINITLVRCEGEKIEAYFKNVGATKFESFEGFDVIIYGRSVSGAFVAQYLNGRFSIIKELINPGIFDPQETAKVEIHQPLSQGNYTLLICTPNAICSSFEFSIGGGRFGDS